MGPTDLGEIPAPSLERLSILGDWLVTNGEAIYGTSPNPYPYEFRWGRITTKGNRLYLLFFFMQEEVCELVGLKSPVVRAYALADPDQSLVVERIENDQTGHIFTRIFGYSSRDIYSVSVLEFDGEPEVDGSLVQQPDGVVTRPAIMRLRSKRKRSLRPRGCRSRVSSWCRPASVLGYRRWSHCIGTTSQVSICH